MHAYAALLHAERHASGGATHAIVKCLGTTYRVAQHRTAQIMVCRTRHTTQSTLVRHAVHVCAADAAGCACVWPTPPPSHLVHCAVCGAVCWRMATDDIGVMLVCG